MNTTKISLVATALFAGISSTALATGTIIEIDIIDGEAWGDAGSANNDVILFDLTTMYPSAAAGATITGVGWDVTVATNGGSWQSELTFAITDSLGDSLGVFLSPGAGSSTPGTGTFSSGGIIKLVDAALPDIEITDGIIAIEMYEAFDDPSGTDNGATLDSITNGTLFLQIETTDLPAPGGLALLGLAACSRRRRRR
ncbi:MAG: hypothetical protein AAF432_15755 [Planctomycetota bacterium]